VLSAAAQRSRHLVLPLPERLKGNAAQKVVQSLTAKHLIEEAAAQPGEPVWREEDGSAVTLIATEAALAALGITPERTAAAPDQGKVDPDTALARKPRDGSKQALLIAMLSRPEGASLDEIITATEWQAHTVRGAISGTLKTRLGLTITSERVDSRGRVYRIDS
jgi:hypothetical protein